MKRTRHESVKLRRERFATGDFSGKTRHDKIYRFAFNKPVGAVFHALEVNAALPPKFKQGLYTLDRILTLAPFVRRVAPQLYERIHSSADDMDRLGRGVVDA